MCNIRPVTDHRPPAAYLASPLGFSTPGRYWYHEVLLPALTAREIDALDPWCDGAELAAALAAPAGRERDRALRSASRELAERNFAMIRRADAVLAVLDGADVDSGTAAEMGYALALDVPVFGLRTDTRRSGDHELAHVNLQVEECVYASGGIIATELDDALDALTERVAIRRAAMPATAEGNGARPPSPRRSDRRPAWVEDERLRASTTAPTAPATRPRLGRFTRVAERA